MWIINKKKRKKKTGKEYGADQRGMTLVELLVAFAVSAIVLTGLSYMLFSSLRLYGRTNANVDAQNESQTALNLVLDSILSAKGIVLTEQDPSSVGAGEITCAMFGELEVRNDKSMKFTGDAVLWQPDVAEMYLMSGTYELGVCSDEAMAPKEAMTAMKGLLPADAQDRLPYLMAQNITAFQIECAEECFAVPTPTPVPAGTPDPGKIKNYFDEPLILNVSMTVEVDYQNDKSVTREMSDSVAVRNRLSEVYIDRDGAGIIKYLRYQNG